MTISFMKILLAMSRSICEKQKDMGRQFRSLMKRQREAEDVTSQDS